MGRLHLICGDFILNSKGMDAIVNAQNKYMQMGSGICGAIYKAAGSQLEEYCKKTYTDYMRVGEIRITKGFNLPMDIIHILAPKYYEEKEPINSLMDCYNNLLFSIKEKGYKKVLIPSLGTGVHGYKHEDIVKPLINLLMEFCEMNDVCIYLNNMLPIQKDIYLKYYLQVKNLDIKNDLKEKNIDEIKLYLDNNNLMENGILLKYNNFVKNMELDDLCLSQKLIFLEYMLYNSNLDRKQYDILIDSM